LAAPELRFVPGVVVRRSKTLIRFPFGVGRGRLPSITERSEWQRPAAAIFTNTSPRPGSASSTSSMVSGRVVAYGGSCPIFQDCGTYFHAVTYRMQR
jgi:hypothetical protein